MKIKEAVEIYNKYRVMKNFVKLLEDINKKEDVDEYIPFTTQFRWRFSSIVNDLKDLADVAIKEYEEVLNGEYEKD